MTNGIQLTTQIFDFDETFKGLFSKLHSFPLKPRIWRLFMEVLPHWNHCWFSMSCSKKGPCVKHGSSPTGGSQHAAVKSNKIHIVVSSFHTSQLLRKQVGNLPIHNWKFDFFLFNIQSQKSVSVSFKSKKPRWRNWGCTSQWWVVPSPTNTFAQAFFALYGLFDKGLKPPETGERM